MIRNNNLKILTIIAVLSILKPGFATGETMNHSQRNFRFEEGWSLLFSDGSSVLLQARDAKKISFRIERGSLATLYGGQSAALIPRGFAEYDQTPFSTHFDRLYQKRLEAFAKRKSEWERKEQLRFQTESKKWNSERNLFETRQKENFQKALTRWTAKKQTFEKKEEERFRKAKEKWQKKQEKEDIEFQEDHAEWVKEKQEHEQDERERVKEEIDELKEDLKDDEEDIFEDAKKDRQFWAIRKTAETKTKECSSGKTRESCRRRIAIWQKGIQNDNYKKLRRVRAEYRKKIRAVKAEPFDEKEPNKQEYVVEKPKRKRFLDLKPRKPTIRYRDQVAPPLLQKPYLEKRPVKEKTIGYSVLGLFFRMSGNGCRAEEFKLRMKGDFFYAKSKPGGLAETISWPEEVPLESCAIVGRNRSQGRTFFRLLYARNRPFAFDLGKTPIRLEKIGSPALKKLDGELAKRDLYVKDLLSFRSSVKGEPVFAVYETAIDRGKQFVTVEYSVSKGRVKLLMESLPHFLLDASIKNRKRKIDRVSYLKEAEFQGTSYPLLRTHYWYDEGKTSKEWQYLARYKYGLLSQNRLGTRIDRNEKKVDGEIRQQSVSITGLVGDFTSLWYVLPWWNAKGRKTLEIGFYDDKIYQGLTLDKNDTESRSAINFADFEGHQRRVPLQKWSLKNSQTQKSVFAVSIGKRDNIVYRLDYEGISFSLVKIKSKSISDNIDWYLNFLQTADIVRLK